MNTKEEKIKNGLSYEKNGWKYISIKGKPKERGYAYGYLCANEFKEIQKILVFLIMESYGQTWDFFIEKVSDGFKKMTQDDFPEFYEEMEGITDGCNANGCKTTIDEIITWNFYMSIPYWYSVISDSRTGRQGGSGDKCSAFMAVGDWTEDGKIVCAHNSFADFIDGQFSNIVLDLNPDKGHRFIMQTSPCWIWSGSDFFVTAKGIIGTETTIGGFYPYEKKYPIGYRIRKAMQYGNTLDDYVKYLQTLGLKEITFKTYKNRLEQLLGKEINSKRDITNIETYASLEEICDYVDDIKDFDTINNFHNQFSAAVTNLISFRDDLSIKQQKTNEIKPVFVFVIDEINRGEISKIFGELFFSIDPSYRGKKGAVKTQYSNLHSDDKEVFYVPDNVYIIGSMNDIDRSVESFDFAMRRRFTWIEISAEQSAENMNLPDETKTKMTKLNEQISLIEGLNPSYHIGAAYFLDSNGNVRQDYDSIWNLRIEPLLKEYLRGMPDSFHKIELLKNAFTA